MLSVKESEAMPSSGPPLGVDEHLVPSLKNHGGVVGMGDAAHGVYIHPTKPLPPCRVAPLRIWKCIELLLGIGRVTKRVINGGELLRG